MQQRHQFLDSGGRKNGSTDGTKVESAMPGMKKLGRLTMRGKSDDLPQYWWFASTAIPLLAATIGPLANVLSIAAIVSKWRVTLPNEGQLPEGTDSAGVDIPDPKWAFVLNCLSLGFGVLGNVFLLLNFVQRVRYIVALPVTIISWYFATGILIGITISMQLYVPPIRPAETYSQGFWHAIIAGVLYLAGSMLLMVNMLGYFLGHYPQHFDLDEHQRTLILQTMMFFFWLAGGAAVFARVCGMSYADSLYFCDVTVLTVGFGDVLANNDVGRGLVFPYSVFGIIFLGLMINSIHQFAMSMSKENVIHKHALSERQRTFERTVTTEKELCERLNLPTRPMQGTTASGSDTEVPHKPLHNYGRFETRGQNVVFREQRRPSGRSSSSAGLSRIRSRTSRRDALRHNSSFNDPYVNKNKLAELTRRRRNELIILREDRDRFNAIRDIQAHIGRFKSYYSLFLSIIAFTMLWCVGAAVFWVAEHRIQGLNYFQCLYFCYVSLLTIGYGDYSPRSNAGKPFFVVWSLMAVPTMTILVSDLGDTIVKSYNRGTFTLADWTIMPKRGVWNEVVKKFFSRTEMVLESRRSSWVGEVKAVERGIDKPSRDASNNEAENSLNTLIRENDLSDVQLARRLAKAIKKISADLRAPYPKKYTYEEWVEFGLLIRFSASNRFQRHNTGEGVEEGKETLIEEILEWDWIGEDSPMLTGLSESEWVLERLCESLERYTKAQVLEAQRADSYHKHHQIIRPPMFPGSGRDGVDDSKDRYDDRVVVSSPLETEGDGNTSSTSSARPVLSRGPSGIEIVKLGSRAR